MLPPLPPQRGTAALTNQAVLFQKYLTSLIQQLSPGEDGSPGHASSSSLKGSLGKLSPSSSIHSTSSIRDYLSNVPPLAPQRMRKSRTTHLDHPLSSNSSSVSSLQSTRTQPLVTVTRSVSPEPGNTQIMKISDGESPERESGRDSPADLSMDELDTSEETEL